MTIAKCLWLGLFQEGAVEVGRDQFTDCICKTKEVNFILKDTGSR